MTVEAARDAESWRVRVRRFAAPAERPLLLFAAFAAFVLGFVGYLRHLPSRGFTSVADAATGAAELFKLKASLGSGRVPIELNVARLLAPAVTLTAAARGALAISRDRLDLVRTRRRVGHVAVLGGGPSVLRFVGSLDARDRRRAVVVGELDPAALARLRTLGVAAISLTGDTAWTSPNVAPDEVLHLAGAERAAHVVVLTGDDHRNLALGLAAKRALAHRRDRPTVVVVGADPEAASVFRADDLVGHDGGARLDVVDVDDLLARRLLAAAPQDGPVLIHAPRRVAAALLLRVAASNVSQELDDPHRSAPPSIRRVLLSGPGSAGSTSSTGNDGWVLAARVFDRLADAVPCVAVSFEEQSGEGEVESFASAIVVGDSSSVVTDAVRLARRRPDVMVVVAVPDAPIYLDVVPSALQTRIRLVDLLGDAGDPELILGGTFEVIARATHERYLEERRRLGSPDGDDPATRPWAELPAHLRASNLAQARHLGIKLARVGASLAPLRGRLDPVVFDAAERELLARLEHERWCDERRAAGWTNGPRDPARKQTPFLVPWEQLDEPTRDLDRNAVDGLPGFLADVGYRIVRVTGPASPEQPGADAREVR